jgi:protein-S-isoprenylcysteine O-methyltransferase Ste14
VIPVNLFLARGDSRPLRRAGVLVLVLASVFIFAPAVFLWRHGRTEDSKSYMHTNAVADSGPYALVRHPQYLGYMLLAAGFSLLSQHWLAYLLAAVGVACFYTHAIQEEAYCLKQLGEPYQQYLRRVPRFNVVKGIVRVLRGKEATPS